MYASVWILEFTGLQTVHKRGPQQYNAERFEYSTLAFAQADIASGEFIGTIKLYEARWFDSKIDVPGGWTFEPSKKKPKRGYAFRLVSTHTLGEHRAS
jgi:hypothetical protein